jgi:O-acetyl-ADP-ribose deacetylase (regulator of RNase III)
MPRFEENSISAIIRFEGARKDAAGRVVADHIADELAARVAGTTPVVAGTAITTGSGELAGRNNVRYLIHVAAVQGEPGQGYRQITDIGRCATNALAEAENLGGPEEPARTILLPIFGTGVAGAAVRPTVRAILGAIIDHFANRAKHSVRVVYLLASKYEELEIAQSIFDTHPRLARIMTPRP